MYNKYTLIYIIINIHKLEQSVTGNGKNCKREDYDELFQSALFDARKSALEIVAEPLKAFCDLAEQRAWFPTKFQSRQRFCNFHSRRVINANTANTVASEQRLLADSG